MLLQGQQVGQNNYQIDNAVPNRPNNQIVYPATQMQQFIPGNWAELINRGLFNVPNMSNYQSFYSTAQREHVLPYPYWMIPYPYWINPAQGMSTGQLATGQLAIGQMQGKQYEKQEGGHRNFTDLLLSPYSPRGQVGDNNSHIFVS